MFLLMRGLSVIDNRFSIRLLFDRLLYDAMRSKRIYKPPFSHEKVAEFIFSEKGKQFCRFREHLNKLNGYI
jgi:hypothetical protein